MDIAYWWSCIGKGLQSTRQPCIVFTFSAMNFPLPTPRKVKYVAINLLFITYLGQSVWDSRIACDYDCKFIHLIDHLHIIQEFETSLNTVKTCRNTPSHFVQTENFKSFNLISNQILFTYTTLDMENFGKAKLYIISVFTRM